MIILHCLPGLDTRDIGLENGWKFTRNTNVSKLLFLLNFSE